MQGADYLVPLHGKANSAASSLGCHGSTVVVVDSDSICGKALRKSLSDWYSSRPEPDSDDEEDANENGRDCENLPALDTGDSIADADVHHVLATTPPTSPRVTPSRRRGKRRSLGEWYLDNERQPSAWTPDTKVVYLGDDRNELARELDLDLHFMQDSPFRSGQEVNLFSEPESREEDQGKRRRRHSIHGAFAAAKSSPRKRPTAEAYKVEDVDPDPLLRNAVEIAAESELTMSDAPRFLPTVEDFLGASPAEFPSQSVEDFLSDDPKSLESWVALNNVWEVLVELFEDTRQAAQDFTVYLWDSAREEFTCIRHGGMTAGRSQGMIA
jgi:hypothetical protein